MKNKIIFLVYCITTVILFQSCGWFNSSQIPLITSHDFELFCSQDLDNSKNQLAANNIVVGIDPIVQPVSYDWHEFKVTIYPVTNGNLGNPMVSDFISYPADLSSATNSILFTKPGNSLRYFKLKDAFPDGVPYQNGIGPNPSNGRKYRVELHGKWSSYLAQDKRETDVYLSTVNQCEAGSQTGGYQNQR